MKRSYYLLPLLALISIACGILLARASWIGRVGITFLHKEYNFLKIWWQGATGIFIVYLALYFMHNTITRRLPNVGARLTHLLILLLVIAGLYFTNDDFAHTISHRLLGHKFHWGAYLFWVGWAVICLYFMVARKTVITTTINTDRRETIS